MTNAVCIADEAAFNRLVNAIHDAEEIGEDATGLRLELADFCMSNARPDQTPMDFMALMFTRLKHMVGHLEELEKAILVKRNTTIVRVKIDTEVGMMIGACEGFAAAHGTKFGVANDSH